MLTKSAHKVNIITLGCSKNLVDSEQLAMQLQASEYEVTHEQKKINYGIAIVNTCGFIESAKEESIQTILQQLALKSEGKIQKVYVTGCLSERYQKELRTELPEVDGFFGTMELPNLLSTLNANYQKDLLGERLLYTPKHYAYLKIAEGCNRTCSFCAIPFMRGAHQSKPIENVVQEARHLASQGAKEILLIAQELTYYGLDIYKKRMLPLLLEKLSEIEELKWIRLHYAYPSKFPLEVIDVMKQKENICKYLDMPLQHASNHMLQKMNRQISLQEMRTCMQELRKRIPNIVLRTTFMVGFPGETEQDVDILCDFIQEQQFDRVGVFEYSHEEGTRAYELVDDVPSEVKKERYERVMLLQQGISTLKNKQKIGQVLDVLVDKKEAGKYLARSEGDSPEVDNEIIIHTDQKLQIGAFYKVLITKAYDYDLEAVLAP